MEIMSDYGRGINEAFHQVDGYNANMAQTSGKFTVTPDNVLAAAKIIHNQARILRRTLENAIDRMRVEPPGNDDVSSRIAPAWNGVLLDEEDSYANRVWEYVNGLSKLAQQCEESARAYGYTDEQIAAAFGAPSA